MMSSLATTVLTVSGGLAHQPVTSERRRRSSRSAQHTAGAVQKQRESFLWTRMTSLTLWPSRNGAGGDIRGEDTMEVSAAASEALAACGRPENEGRRGGNRPTAELRSCGAAKLATPPPAPAYPTFVRQLYSAFHELGPWVLGVGGSRGSPRVLRVELLSLPRCHA